MPLAPSSPRPGAPTGPVRGASRPLVAADAAARAEVWARAEARERILLLVEAVQAGDPDAGEAIDAVLADATERGWADVERLGLFACAVRALVTPNPELPLIVERLRASAEAGGDVAMLATALSWRAFAAVSGQDPGRLAKADADLARARVLLESAPASRETASAHLSCGTAFTERQLWELADESYRAAGMVLPAGDDPRLESLVSYDSAEVQLRWACALRELGMLEDLEERSRAGWAAISTARRTPMPALWARDIEVMAVLLDAVDGHDVREAARSQLADYRASRDLKGHLHLALALSESAHGDLGAAVAAAARATESISPTRNPGEYDLSLRVAAELEERSCGRRTAGLAYAERLAGARWRERLSALGTMRLRLETERRSAEYEQLSRQVHADHLTGVANRRGLDRYLDTLRGGAADQAAVLVVDLDRFKAINDTWGHAVGDSVLEAVARVLTLHVRAEDLVARIGGDEFLVVLAGADRPTAMGRCDAIAAAVGTIAPAGLPEGAVAVSIGLAVGPGANPHALIAAADTALYRAKEAGRSRTVCA